MTTHDSYYVNANAEAEPERSRLKLLEQMNDEATLRRIDRIGVAEGSRCLELGAGAGSIARALAERAGPSGCVVAADRDPRFLGDFVGPGRQVITHDIIEGRVKPGGFDFAHCRALLAHVPDLNAAIRHFVASVRPGGWILCEEPDYGAMEPCDPTHPHADDILTFRAMMTHGERFDGFAGRHAFSAFQALGLPSSEAESHGAIATGGTMRATFRKEPLLRARPLIVESGAFPKERFDRLLAAFDDPTLTYIDNSWIATWARVPE